MWKTSTVNFILGLFDLVKVLFENFLSNVRASIDLGQTLYVVELRVLHEHRKAEKEDVAEPE